MVGGERDREAVRWELGDAALSNAGASLQQQRAQQTSSSLADQQQVSASPSNDNHASSGFDSAMDVVGDGTLFNDDEADHDDDEDAENGTGGIIGGAAAGGAGNGMRSGSTAGSNAGGGLDFGSKEVRYAPFPITTTSPTHSNPTTTCPQIPLQRAHSRFYLFAKF